MNAYRNISPPEKRLVKPALLATLATLVVLASVATVADAQDARAVLVPSAKQLNLRPEAVAKVIPLPPPKILTPAAGSSIEEGKLHVQVKPAGGVVARQAEVEFVWQPLAPKPDAMLVPSPGLWAVPMNQLVSGVTVPEAAKPQTTGRWIVRVRSADGAPGAWSESVPFNLVANTAGSKPNQDVSTFKHLPKPVVSLRPKP